MQICMTKYPKIRTDNAFMLNTFVDKYLSKKGIKLYIAFVDFRKAFDSINRGNLEILASLVNYTLQFKVSCVRANRSFTNFFECPTGLKQACLLSPVLFSIFIEKLVDKLIESGIRGLQLFPEIIEILVLLFADDVILLSGTIIGLQRVMIIMYKLKLVKLKFSSLETAGI